MKPPLDDETRARNRRSLVIAGGLVVFVVLIFVIAIVRMGGNVAHF